jgi:hypothetical protein
MITPDDIEEKGLMGVIIENYILDAWFNAYYKNRSEDASYDYREDEDIWDNSKEILGDESFDDDEEAEDMEHNIRWAKSLNYILNNKPNPFDSEALDNAINNS